MCQNPISLYSRGREVRRNQGDLLPAYGGWALTFDVVFGVFAAAMVAIAVLSIRWAVGRDREARRLKDQSGGVGKSEQ